VSGKPDYHTSHQRMRTLRLHLDCGCLLHVIGTVGMMSRSLKGLSVVHVAEAVLHASLHSSNARKQ
jgi:hypothetical protein